MKISFKNSLLNTLPGINNNSTQTPGVSGGNGKKFSDFISAEHFDSLKEIKERLISGKDISARELLTYQIKSHDVHLKVELIGKVAETALASAKRLQQG